MNKITLTGVALAAMALSVSLSCGGPNAGGGVGGTGISFGTITGFGSVFVNGVEFDSSGADIRLNDIPGSEADLAIGMVVTVRGSIHSNGTSGTADSITYKSKLEGPIDSINEPAGSLVVAGQNVTVNAGTIFDDIIPADLTGLNPGNIVEVSGFIDAEGVIRATRIKFETDQFEQGTTEIEVKGTISNLDTNALTFTLGDLTVDYSNADIPQSGLSNGLAVEVHSTLGFDNEVLLASRVQIEEGPLDETEGEKVEVEGFVTSFTSATDFEVNGQRIRTDSGTQFSGGGTGDIALNVKLEIKGTIIAGNILLADKIEIENESEGEGEGESESSSDH